jgi:nucleoside 2-deoxyribosyltransferase
VNEKLVYLAGPISICSYEQAVGWRDYVRSKLPPHIKGMSPMRWKTYLGSEKAIKDHYDNHPLATTRGITTRDRNDTMRADLVFVNFLGAERVSIGTVIEIGWADMLRKPIVICMTPDNPHWHGMVRECAGFIVPTLDEGIETAIAVLSTGERE